MNLMELQEFRTAVAKIEQRQKEISARVKEIEAARKEALQHTAEDFRDSCISLIRGAESATRPNP